MVKKTKAVKNPETTIEYDLKATLIINDEVDKKYALSILDDILEDAFDKLEIKGIKLFQKNV